MSPEERLAVAFLDAHPPRAARLLEQMPMPRAAAVLGAVPARVAATVIAEMAPPQAAECLGRLPAGDAAAIIAATSGDAAVGIVRVVDTESRERMFAELPGDTREMLARVLPYPAGTAGAVMDPSVFRVGEDVLVADARERLRRAKRGLLYYVYAVDGEHRLVGVLDIAELMLARPRDRVGAAMHRDVDRLPAWTPAALVRAHPGWQRYHAMPVVDDENRLLGAIRYQTLRRLEREAADRGPDPSLLTARALGELFRLGTTGLVAGVAPAAPLAESPPLQRPPAAGEARDGR